MWSYGVVLWELLTGQVGLVWQRMKTQGVRECVYEHVRVRECVCVYVFK